ncbi:uncharacterized protein LOC119583347 [Penaeus monodon]|uniref:uncharacterized protein LOC119583347 n=1 Tax=Penaeus monodon TaxID=6687 RepID=UPI0018A76C30|nr:uncharacterized protein LOC119583347 [Penaeus monodon]
MDETDLQEMVDHLNDAHMSAARHINTVPPSQQRPRQRRTTLQWSTILHVSAGIQYNNPTRGHDSSKATRNSPTASAILTPDIRFLVDTGAAHSLLPASRWRKPHQQQPVTRLTAANSTPIPTYGRKYLNICIDSRTYGWSFVVADITLPLLGADFLAHYQLLVDVSSGRLIDAASLAAIPIAAAPDNLALQVIDAADDYAHLHYSYPDVFKSELRQQPQTPAKHGIYHLIKTSGPPVFSKFLVKKDGFLRPCGDYRCLDMPMEPDHYLLPNIADVTSSTAPRFFSKLDLLKGYYQVPMHPEDIHAL